MRIEMNNRQVQLHQGDSRDVLKTLADSSIDSIVCDPPYALVSIQKRFAKSGRTDSTASKSDAHQRFARGFMGKTWDNEDTAFAETFWAECLRVLKPGGHVVAFGGTRTYHRLVCAIEDAGFEIRDCLSWIYGSGFPKSHNQHGDWEGWGTALKPAFEPICLARKPLGGTVASNLSEWGVGALNIDGCRVGWPDGKVPEIGTPEWGGPNKKSTAVPGQDGETVERFGPSPLGRWPANIIHDGSDEVLAAFPDAKGQQGDLNGQSKGRKSKGIFGDMPAARESLARIETDTSAARFFQVCQSDDEDWLCQNLNLLPAGTAEGYSLQSSEPAYSALVHAASEALPEGLFCESLSTPPSTNATPKQLKNLAESFITATQSIAARFLPEWQQERLSQKDSPVSVVATRSPTGTTQITVSHWISSGSADPVIFNIMPTNSEAGAKACAQFTAGRFLYNPKASRKDRDEGITGAPFGPQFKSGTTLRMVENAPKRGNIHPTVKPTSLMQYLCRLITPPGGTILDPFMGSGSTGKAAVLEGFNFVGIEREDEYMPIAEARIAWAVLRMAARFADHETAAVAPRPQPANDNGDLFSVSA